MTNTDEMKWNIFRGQFILSSATKDESTTTKKANEKRNDEKNVKKKSVAAKCQWNIALQSKQPSTQLESTDDDCDDCDRLELFTFSEIYGNGWMWKRARRRLHVAPKLPKNRICIVKNRFSFSHTVTATDRHTHTYTNRDNKMQTKPTGKRPNYFADVILMTTAVMRSCRNGSRFGNVPFIFLLFRSLSLAVSRSCVSCFKRFFLVFVVWQLFSANENGPHGKRIKRKANTRTQEHTWAPVSRVIKVQLKCVLGKNDWMLRRQRKDGDRRLAAIAVNKWAQSDKRKISI